MIRTGLLVICTILLFAVAQQTKAIRMHIGAPNPPGAQALCQLFGGTLDAAGECE